MLFAGCAPKNYDYISSDSSISTSKRIELHIYPQDSYYCGPSSLATVFKKEQIVFNYDDLSQHTFTPGLKGTLQPQMKAAARKYGLIPYETGKSLKDILLELSNDTSVIVLFNLGLKTVPVWHYSVVTGYDKAEKKVFLSAPNGSETWMSFEEFETFFERGGSWAISLIKPPKLPKTSSENNIIAAILDMYEINQKEVAKQAAVSHLSNNPASYQTMVLLANIYLKEDDYRSAAFMYNEILKIKPKEPSILNNLAAALLKQKKYDEAKKYAIEAVKIGGKFAQNYQNTLDEIEKAIKEQK